MEEDSRNISYILVQKVEKQLLNKYCPEHMIKVKRKVGESSKNER